VLYIRCPEAARASLPEEIVAVVVASPRTGDHIRGLVTPETPSTQVRSAVKRSPPNGVGRHAEERVWLRFGGLPHVRATRGANRAQQAAPLPRTRNDECTERVGQVMTQQVFIA